MEVKDVPLDGNAYNQDHYTLDYEIFDHTGRNDLDVVYLGVEVNVPLFEILLLEEPSLTFDAGFGYSGGGCLSLAFRLLSLVFSVGF